MCLLGAATSYIILPPLCQKRQSLCGQACEKPEEPTLNFHIVNNLTFTHFYCDAFSILTSFCHSVHL